MTPGQARTVARDLFGLDVREIRPLPGERDRNFYLQDVLGHAFALRVLHPAEDPAVTDFQTRAMMHVATAEPSLPIPRVVPPVHGEAGDVAWDMPGAPARRVRCVTYLRGRPLYKTAATVAQRRSVGTFLARLDLALADFRHAADDHELLWDLKRADRARDLIRAIPAASRRALPGGVLERFARDIRPRLHAMRHQTVHNDFNPHNILASFTAPNEIAGVIDFGDMVRGPLVQDLATACAYQLPTNAHPLQGAADLATAFHAVYPLTDDEVSILPDLVATRLALSAAITSWRAARHPGNAEYILRNSSTVWTSLERLESLPREEAVTWLNDHLFRGNRIDAHSI